jgi:hypothetical protein
MFSSKLIKYAKSEILPLSSLAHRILTPPPERRIHPAGRRAALGLPDESGVPIGMAARPGGGVRMRPAENWAKIGLAFPPAEAQNRADIGPSGVRARHYGQMS